MRLRSFVCLLLVLALGVLFSGCDNTAPADPTDVTQVTEPTDSVATSDAAPDVSPTPSQPVATSDAVPGVSPTPSQADTGRETFASVNGYPLYLDDLEAAKSSILNQYAQTYAQFGMNFSDMLGGADGLMLELGIEADAFQQLVQVALTQAEADSRDIEITAEETQAEFDSQYVEFLAAQGWTEEDLSLYLDQQGQNLESFKASVKEYIANQLLAMEVQHAVAGEFDITDEQIEAYFVENESEYSISEQIRASHILVETREEAEQIVADLANGAEFAELARELSTDPGSGANGGDLNWFGRGAMVAPFEEAAFALEVGELSDIVETDYGFHVILLTDHQAASVPELTDVIDQVREDLEGELIYERAVEWYTGVLATAQFDIARPLLAAIIKQAEDIEAAIAILERAQAEGTSDDPYLPFVLGTFYGQQLTAAIDERDAEGLDAAQIAEIEARIAEYRTKALAALQAALENVGEDAGIQSKIDGIEAVTLDTEEP
ncbi:peptidylprolyl isomerase [Candidatus Bipolaricaulota bacterium]|nr:peptidylprolyl isomerase [Candidatus Bipolaricaulota bacterium]TFH08874.1 MAG: hypothetical protein E4H08_06940 [Candidatus Atribacteria bacterium]